MSAAASLCCCAPQVLVPLQVVFPLVLDTYELCTGAYKKELDGPREALAAEEDRKAGLEKAAKRAKQVHIYRAQACKSRSRGPGWCPGRPAGGSTPC